MKRTIKLLLVPALVATVVASVPAASHAGKGEAARPLALSARGGGAPAQQSWLGAAAKFACREGFQYIGTPAFTAFSGFCFVWFLDALIS